MKIQKINFPNSKGDQLSGLLYLPLDEIPRFYALFAHCFTCSKNYKAVSSISQTLCQMGVAVLSFDFTGLGGSEGQFEEEKFSSNVSDLLRASDYLAKNHQVPQLLIGHSLGGAAVIFAAAQLEAVKAVVTIGSPSQPNHVKRLLSEDLENIQNSGKARVNIGGRPFLISEEFIQDLESQDLLKLLSEMRKAFLFLHSPQDLVVEISNAADLYSAAFHPKSFISLDGADHLLTDEHDSWYVGEIISTWSKKYLPGKPTENDVKGNQVKVRLSGDSFTSEVLTPFHHLLADEPKSVGGQNLGPTPYDLLMASLGTCTAMTLKMYADRKGWRIGEINVYLNHEKVHRKDGELAETGEGKISKFTRLLEIKGNLTPDMEEKLLEIANKCPVHKTLHEPIQVETRYLKA